MKSIVLLLFAFIISGSAFAQRTIQMRNLWIRPQVHVIFGDYTISFTIKDIDRALELLGETGDTSYGTTCGLDTSGNYFIELYPGNKMEYHKPLEPLIQKGVGVFLLSAGHAYIEDKKHKPVKSIIMDIQPLQRGVDDAYILFYDERNNNMLFSGRMAADMYNKDLGIN